MGDMKGSQGGTILELIQAYNCKEYEQKTGGVFFDRYCGFIFSIF